jgi:hypothetical protein
MNLTLLNALEWGSYLIVLVSAICVSWKKGEKEGSRFMLQYLREEKFLDDTGYNQFMLHIREEEKKNGEDLSDKD